MRTLDDVEFAAVAEPAPNHLGRLTEHEFIRGPIRVIDEEHAPVWPQRVGHELPERLEAVLGDVGEPEAEEDDVVHAPGTPAEDVGGDEADVRLTDACRGALEHLGRRVDRGQAGGVAKQLRRPGPGAAGELEHVAGRRECVKGIGEIAAPGALDRVVLVRAGNRTVVRRLLAQDRVARKVAISHHAHTGCHDDSGYASSWQPSRGSRSIRRNYGCACTGFPMWTVRSRDTVSASAALRPRYLSLGA